MRPPLPVLVLIPFLAASPAAPCATGAKCLKVPVTESAAPYAPGDVIPDGEFNLLLNVTYHGLPPSDGTFLYARTGRHVYRVDARTLAVIEDVTRDARHLRR